MKPHPTNMPLPAGLEPASELFQAGQKLPVFNRIKPSLGRVVLEELPAEEMTEGGIYIPKMSQQNQGGSAFRVVWVCDPYYAAEDDKDGSPSGPQYQVGQYVLVGKYSGVDIQLGRKRYVSCNESDVLGELVHDNAT